MLHQNFIQEQLLAFKEKLFQSKYVFSKIGKFRRGSQGNQPTALNAYEV